MSVPSTLYAFPPALKPKGTIGIVSPSRWSEPVWLDETTRLLQEHGHQVVVHTQNYLKQGRLAGSDAARAEAIMDMFDDSTIDAILCARGGCGAVQLLDKLDYKLIAKTPKPFIGFSDATALVNAIVKRAGFVAYHGPMSCTFGKPHDPRTLTDMLSVLSVRQDEALRMVYNEVEVVRPGQVEGYLIGGNLTLLQAMIGSVYEWSSRDAVLFIEDTGEEVYALARTLKHLQLAGKFKHIRAVLVGKMVNITDSEADGDIPYGKSVREVLMDILPKDAPLAFDFPCGHTSYLTTLPVGARVQLALSEQEGAVLSFTAP